MSAISDEGEAAREDSADDLSDEKRCGDCKSDGEPTLVEAAVCGGCCHLVAVGHWSTAPYRPQRAEVSDAVGIASFVVVQGHRLDEIYVDEGLLAAAQDPETVVQNLDDWRYAVRGAGGVGCHGVLAWIVLFVVDAEDHCSVFALLIPVDIRGRVLP